MTMTAGPRTTKTFEFEVIDGDGKRSKGKIEAPNETAVVTALQQRGVTPISIGETGTGLNREIHLLTAVRGRVTLKDLAIFCRQFATMNSAGLSLLRSLTILEEQTEKPALNKAIRQVRRDIEGGMSLSGALGKQDKVFPPLMVAMINAGETGGFLDSALDRIASSFEKDANLRATIKSAMTYPAIVICFSLVMITGVLIFIVPVFERMFHNLGAKLPLPTRILVGVSHQMFWIVPLAVALAVGIVTWMRRKLREDYAWRLGFDRLKLRLPIFGSLLAKIAISRFARNFGTLLAVGVPVMQALDVVGGTTGNAVVGEAMKDVQNSVRDGQPMSAPLTKHPIFPAMVTHMMAVGEETGQVSSMLEKVADFYDHEVETATESLTAAIEPVMVVVMGALVGVMVICLYLPMFTIYQHIQGATQ
jgi:type IV pilus assembly protein PilC